MNKPSDKVLTPAQSQALDRVAELMTEHFTGYAVVYDIEGTSDEGGHVTGHQYHGGQAMACGLLRLASVAIEHDHLGLHVKGESKGDDGLEPA